MDIFNTNSDYYLSNVVFLNKNKAFGAFILRKGYTKNILLSLAIANLSFVVAMAFVFIILQNKKEEIEYYKMIDYKTTDFSLEQIKIPRIEQKKTEQKTQTQKIKDNPLVVEDELKPEKPLTEKPEDNKNGVGKGEAEVKSDEKGKADATEIIKSVSSDTSGSNLYSQEIFLKVEIPAEFAGGQLAFGKFLGENIRYPEYAKKNKIDGIVYVHMIVNSDGSISDLKIYKGIEESCNNEVLRVMKLSPKWIPARQKEHFVRQRLIVPIRFRAPL